MNKAVTFISHLFPLIIFSTTVSAEVPQLVLPPDQWQQISLPVNLDANNTVADIFADDIPGVYDTDWVLFSYDALNNIYLKPALTDTVSQGVGYWIIQSSGDTIHVDLPESATDTAFSQTIQCPSTSGCFTIPLPTQAGNELWSMLGNPFGIRFTWNQSRIVTDSGVCSDSDGCTLDEAQAQNIFQNQAWHYQNPDYETIEGNTIVQTWDGFWVATLAGADGLNPRLLLSYDPLPTGGGISQADAARFLTQSTFGPTFEGIQQLVEMDSYETWLNEQFTLPVALQLPQARVVSTKMCYDIHTEHTSAYFPRTAVWWDAVVEGDDQLRQRVAFALSEIFVISFQAPGVNQWQFGMTKYYDILLRNAFGNYRDLLEEVTLSPMMGVYLSHINNQKADPEKNIFPDENYAREILQLFSIGVHKLNLNGTLKLDVEGNPIPSYGQKEVKAFARVFTGWVYHGNSGKWGAGATVNPMIAIENDHDTDEKVLLDGAVLPAGQDTRTDLEEAMDNIFNHPNVGPFISRQLIQRLVTSNPSPAYINRVASVFNNNGQGIRGDLKATIAAILLDPEAITRQADATSSGKLREPLLRLTHLWRAFGATKIKHARRNSNCQGSDVYASGGVPFDATISGFGQEILGAPSVFNFFLPSFAPQGAVSNAGLVAPEFQIFTERNILSTTTRLNNLVKSKRIFTSNSVLKLNDEKIWAEDPELMLDKLNLILMNGEMSAELRETIMAHLNTAPFPINENLLVKLEDAIVLIINSPDYLIQK